MKIEKAGLGLTVLLLGLVCNPVAALTSSSKVTASDGNIGDEFGASVSIDADRVIVGASRENENGSLSGSAYLFELDGNGNWVESKLTASDGAAGDRFGWSVSNSEDRAIVGAIGADANGNDSGSAYIFELDQDDNWVETKLAANDGAAQDAFGESVSIDDDRVIVGAYWDDDNGIDSGSAYIYELDENGSWVETKLIASDGAAGDEFGTAVAINGDRAIVGASRHNNNGSLSGAAYVFERDASGNWVETRLAASDSEAGDLYGYAVSIDGDRAIVGAFRDDDNGGNSGSAYVYERDINGVWVETKLTASDGDPGDLFGHSVSLQGGRAVVGAFLDDNDSNSSGSAYVYERDQNGSWVELRVIASDGAASDQFGVAVSIDGNLAIVGAYKDDDNGSSSGSAYLLALDEPQLTAPTAGSALDDPAGTQLFEWLPVLADVSQWWLYIGNQPGSRNIFSSGELEATTLSASVSGLPNDASALYAKLWYQLEGSNQWFFVEESYTAFGSPPSFASPTPGTQLEGAAQLFSWQDNGAGVSQYWLDVGSSAGANDYFSSGNLSAATSVQASGLPSDGQSAVYVRLWYRNGSTGAWQHINETYTAGSGATSEPAITSPTAPGPLTDIDGTEQLTWAANGSGAVQYWVYAGSSVGASDFYSSGNLGNVLSASVTGLPTNGSEVWIRLWYRGAGGAWLSVDQQYTAAGAGPSIDSSNGTGILTTGDDTFGWTDPGGAVTDWWIYVGSSQGAKDYEDSGNLGSVLNYSTVNGNLPDSSVPVYVRLWYREGSGTPWLFMDKVFTAAP